MKQFFKLVGSLLLDQFVGIIGGMMTVLCVSVFFNNNFWGYFLAFVFCFGFYAYVTYNSAFKGGFRDPRRIRKDASYAGHWYKGALAGVVSVLPLLGVLLFYVISGREQWALYYMVADMYWTWPLSGIFKSHQMLIMSLTFVPSILIPWIGYIAGFNNFVVFDKVLEVYRKYTENN